MAAPDTNTLNIFPYCIVIVTSLLLLPGLVLLISFCLVTFLLVPHYLASLQTGLATFFLSGWGGMGRKRQGKDRVLLENTDFYTTLCIGKTSSQPSSKVC